jgi:hypothetical protein
MVNKLWEVEQRADKDSERVIWHCANVRIGVNPIEYFFTVPKKNEPPWELHYQGTCYTDGQDNAIVILGVPDVN